MALQEDKINPSHYKEQSAVIEPIFFCEQLPFCEGNALKYCFRAGHKVGSSEQEDLKKARWYLNRYKSNGVVSKEATGRFMVLVPMLKTYKDTLISYAANHAWNCCGGDDGDVYRGFFDQLYRLVDNRIKE